MNENLIEHCIVNALSEIDCIREQELTHQQSEWLEDADKNLRDLLHSLPKDERSWNAFLHQAAAECHSESEVDHA